MTWDSRTTHANTPNVSGDTRMVAYIATGLAHPYDQAAVNVRLHAFQSGEGSNVRDAMMHASKKPRYNALPQSVKSREAENLSFLGKLLYGIFNDAYDDFLSELLPNKILLNAEAFGYGPTAAIADIFPFIRKHFKHVAYIGEGHALDLQRGLAYDEIYTLDKFDTVAPNYDIFFTALDFKQADRAQHIGLMTVIYDPLTWYWPKIPDIVKKKNVLYIAQDFFGVRKRIEAEQLRAVIVPPIIFRHLCSQQKNKVLINLGGLICPFLSIEKAKQYVEIILNALKQINYQFEFIIATSASLAELMDNPSVKNYSRADIKSMLPMVKCALITPGLSNIYDMASHNIPCEPPFNHTL